MTRETKIDKMGRVIPVKPHRNKMQQRDEIARLRAALDWSGLRIDNPTLNWALKELGPTDTNAEAYVKAAVEHVIYMRDKAHAALKEGA